MRELSPSEREQAELMIPLVRMGWGQENAAFRRLFTAMLIPGATAEEMEWFDDLQRVTTDPDTAARIWGARNRDEVTQEATQVRTPSLVLHARDDALAPFEEGRLLASLVPGARFVPLEGRNHILLSTEPAWHRFLEELQGFGADQRVHAIPPRRGDAVQPRVREPSVRSGEIMGRFYADFGAGNIDGALAACAEDLEIVDPGLGQVNGRERFRDYLETFKRAMPDARALIDHTVESERTVAVEGRFVGTHTGALATDDGDVDPTGETVDLRFADVARVRDGRIVAYHTYYDQFALLKQLGLMEESA